MHPGIDLPGFLFYFTAQMIYPMQTTKTILLGVILSFHLSAVSAQSEPDSVIAKRHALLYADRLVKCNFYQNWNQYIALTCQSAIKYYGGKEQFKEHLVTAYFRHEPTEHEKPEKLRMLTLVNNTDEWQCVIEKVRETWINNRKARIYSYLIGHSEDNGITWKFVDVSHNSLSNLGYIFPQIFGDLPIPEGKTVYVDEIVAQQ